MQKAHPNIQNILLQLLDEGRLTDGKGKTVDFTNTIVICTSNLGAADLIRGMDPKTGTIPAIVKERVMDALRDHFKPEFINRLDDIVIFHPLTPAQLSAIITLIIKQLADRLAGQERNITLTGVTPAAIKHILYESTLEQPEYGARPIKRWVEKHITTTLASLIVQGKLPSHCQVAIDYDAAATCLLFNVTYKSGVKDVVRVHPSKPPQHSGGLAEADDDAYDRSSAAPAVGAGKKRNVSIADEIRGKDRKSRAQRNTRDVGDDDEEDSEAEKMEL